MSVVPVNYRKPDSGAQAVERDVDYALQIADFYLGAVPGGAAAVRGARVLELGPGHSLGAAALLACAGARVTVADRYLAAWHGEYHAAFVRALLARVESERKDLSPAPLRALLAAGDFVPDVLACLHVGSERLDGVPDGAFDVVLSNAVFEHVEDVPAALANLARVTARGGLHVHQVDFRDHRDFARPLEFLALDASAFRDEFRERRGECGNRWRPGALAAAFRAAGFDVLDVRPNMHAEAAYLDDLQPRLHADFRGLSREALSVLSACLVARRAAPSAAPASPAGAELAALQPRDLARRLARYAFVADFARGRRVLDLTCGDGAGLRLLVAAGAREAHGLDGRHDALELARACDPSAPPERYAAWTPGEPLPFAVGGFGLVVALRPLERYEPGARVALVAQARRLLAPDGVALLSCGNRAAGDAGAPGLEEVVTLLADFEWVEFLGQADLFATAVLPLQPTRAQAARGTITLPAGAALDDPSTRSLLALCRRARPLESAGGAPDAWACELPAD